MPPARQPTCPFCDLIHGAGEVSMCFEDADVVAFMDIQPVNAGHLLVAPREHYESLEDIPPPLAMHLFEVAMQLAPVVKKVGGAGGLNLVVNSGAAAGQDVFHYHVHVIPRRADDGFDIPLPFAGSAMPDRTVLDANAARIIAALRDPVASRTRPERRSAVTDRRAPSSHK
jgi:histidine triad (HIT) family protein